MQALQNIKAEDEETRGKLWGFVSEIHLYDSEQYEFHEVDQCSSVILGVILRVCICRR